jgi:hypothetical protein
MQEGGDDALLVEAARRRKIEDVDAAKPVVRRVTDQPLDGGDGIGIGRPPKHVEYGLGVAHGATMGQNQRGSSPHIDRADVARGIDRR